MAGSSLILPASPSTFTKIPIILPTCGGWNGKVRVMMTTTGADATIKEWLFISSDYSGGKIRYRRTGNLASLPTMKNWTLKADEYTSRDLMATENVTTIEYQSTMPITVAWESTRSQSPLPYQTTLPATAGTEATWPGSQYNGKYYWQPS